MSTNAKVSGQVFVSESQNRVYKKSMKSNESYRFDTFRRIKSNNNRSVKSHIPFASYYHAIFNSIHSPRPGVLLLSTATVSRPPIGDLNAADLHRRDRFLEADATC